MGNQGGGAWDNSVWAQHISPLLKKMGQNVGTPNGDIPYDRQVKWDPTVGGYVRVQNRLGEPVRSADIPFDPMPTAPAGPVARNTGLGPARSAIGRLGGQLPGATLKPKLSPLKAIQQAILRGGADTGYNPIGSVLPAPGELPGHSPNDAEPDADGDDGGLERIKQLLLNTVPQGGLDASGPKFDPASPEPSFVGPERPAQPHRSRWGALGQAILRGTRAAFQH